ncbi:MAG: hypothetical protein C0501_13935 [Isosphaera sp.]|nr:hypothetical protein [Isosphaera sp.]
MTRAASFVLLAAGVASAARAEVPVAPPPREVRPDGTRDPVPAAEPVQREDPLEVVDRIVKNSKAVGDRLAKTDTGADTRKTQDGILKDIDALLNPPPDDQPPPPKPDENKDKEKEKKDPKDKDDMPDPMNKSGDPMPPPKGGMNDMPDPKNGMGGGMGNMNESPAGGDRPRDRKPRQGGGQAKQEPAKPEKDPAGKVGSGGQASKAGGAMPDTKGGKPDPSPTGPPPEDQVVKDVWGHLPDKLRQQATQYYKQEFMPRYAELLRLYYASLAEKK